MMSRSCRNIDLTSLSDSENNFKASFNIDLDRNYYGNI